MTLVQEPQPKQQSGFLIYAPVYRNGADTSTVDARRAALLGFVYSPFRIDDFIAPVLTDKKLDVSFKIYDGAEIKPESLLHDTPPESAEPTLSQPQLPSKFSGRIWTIVYSSNPSF